MAQGDLKGQTVLCIYEMTGDTLRIAFAEPGKARPTEIANRDSKGVLLLSGGRQPPEVTSAQGADAPRSGANQQSNTVVQSFFA